MDLENETKLVFGVKATRPVLSLFLDSIAYEILDVEWNKSGLESYETLW